MVRGRDQEGRMPSSLLECVDAHLWPHFLCRRHKLEALRLFRDGAVECTLPCITPQTLQGSSLNPVVFDLISWGVVATTNTFGRHGQEGYGLGAVSSCDAALECMSTGTARCNCQRPRQDRICDANMDGDGGDREGIATAHVWYRKGIHVSWARVSFQVCGQAHPYYIHRIR
jgi:hypothetical protein